MSEAIPPKDSVALIVEASPNAMLIADAAGKIVLVNVPAEKLFGYSRAELLGQPVERLVPERLRGQVPGAHGGFSLDPREQPQGARRDWQGLRKDGTEVPIELGLTPVKIGGGSFILALIIDITERKREEDTLRSQHNLLRTLIDNLPVFIYEKDRERRFLTANTALAQFMGCKSPDELLGKRDEDF